MLYTLIFELSTILIINAIDCLNDNTKYYEIENSEKKTEFENSNNATLPDAETYVIGVKRALLPFRQLSKYLRRPVSDLRSPDGFANIQWKIPSEAMLAPSDVVAKTQNRKRWDKEDVDKASKDVPEIILIRPINVSTGGGAEKTNSLKKDVENAVRVRQRQEVTDKIPEQKSQCIKKQTPAPSSVNKIKIDNQIFQGSGINIKLTFSVDVGNQSKAMASNQTKLSTNKPMKKNSFNRNSRS